MVEYKPKSILVSICQLTDGKAGPLSTAKHKQKISHSHPQLCVFNQPKMHLFGI